MPAELNIYQNIFQSNGYDEVNAVTGRVFVAQSPEQFTYDADGNMLTDGRFRYTWNAENRMVMAEELYAPTNREPYVITYAYDHKGRMVRKDVALASNSPFSILNSTFVIYDHKGRMVRKDVALASNPSFSILHSTFVWDDWNIIRENTTEPPAFQLSNLQTFKPSTDYVWGLDIDGSLQGAGGVGGLLAVSIANTQHLTPNTQLYLPTYDANGNVSEYVSTNGTIAAHYDYSPFGELLMQDGDQAGTFTHRFSTKPYCPITKLVEYQMRKYRPEIGRWLSRDPMGEEDATLYAYCINNTISLIDNLGYTWKIKREGRPYAIAVATDESDSFSSLAIELKLDDEDYAKWAHTNDPNPEVCKEYKIPNTIYYHNGHNKLRDTIFASILASWRRSNRKASGEERSQGYMVIWEDNVSDSAIQHALGDEYLYSYTFTGHGSEGAIINAYKEEGVMPLRYTKYGIQSLILQACCSAEKDPIAGRKFHKYNEWEHNVSRRGYFVGYVGAVNSLNELFLWRITKGTNNYGP